MIFTRSDIPFANDDTHRFLPWLIGVMACLATLLLCLGITINSWIVTRHDNYTASFTVNVPASSTDDTSTLNKIRDTLKRQPGVTDVVQLSDSQIKDMLKPWLGGSGSLDGLPIPAVFNVTLQNTQLASQMDYGALEKSLIAIASGTEVDAHERWVAAFSDFSRAARWLMLVLSILILSSMSAIIAFTSRASLKLHARTVHLLHAIGAEDDYIAGQFQQEAFLLVLPGAGFGVLLAGLIYWIMGFYMASLPVSLMPSLSMTRVHFYLLVGMPLACASSAWAVARLSVLRQLRNVL